MSGTNDIPFLDLVALHADLREELCGVFNAALDTAGFVGGSVVEEFEIEFAAFCGTRHCVGVGSGTDALRFALIAAGIGRGDVVITVPNTFIATTEAISQAGAQAVFVDVDEATCNMDPARLRDYLERRCDRRNGTNLIDRRTGGRVAAIVPVHLYGQTADLDPLVEIAAEHRLMLMEDACQAHGAEYFSRREKRWMKAGSLGMAAAFSFYPGKNLGACGEAGAVTTNDPELAQRIRMLRDHGQAQKYDHELEGYNGRLDAIQAGILKVKLKHLPRWSEMRRRAAARYRELFQVANGPIGLPHEPEWCRSVYHLFMIRVARRDELMQHLASRGIGTGIHYPIPLHLQKAYRHLRYEPGDFPVAEKQAAEILSLPMFPHLNETQQRRVVSEVTHFYSAERAVA